MVERDFGPTNRSGDRNTKSVRRDVYTSLVGIVTGIIASLDKFLTFIKRPVSGPPLPFPLSSLG